MRIEYIIDRSADARIKKSATLARAALSSLCRIDIRQIDDLEMHNIQVATTDYAPNLNVYQYIVGQVEDRRRFDIPPDLSTLLITDKPLVDIRPSGAARRNVIGWSTRLEHEAIATLDHYTNAPNPTIGLAHTIIHESGHLLGASERDGRESHCIKPSCTMSTRTDIKELGTLMHGLAIRRGGFCKHCIEDIKRAE